MALLRYLKRDVCLTPGRYTIGRSPSCDVVVNTAGASRRHACLVVTTSAVSIEDLGSSNGVTINGIRVQGQRNLSPGDQIGIGGELIEFRGLALQPELITTEVSGAEPQTPSSNEDPPTTAKTDELEFIGLLAKRALAQNRLHEAATMLQPRLANVLREAKGRKKLAPPRISMAVEYACLLAVATGDGKWVDYAFELLSSQGVACPESQADSLLRAVQAVKTFDRKLLDQYLNDLMASPRSVERLLAMRHADALVQAFQAGPR
jgi:hypothetical protein